jgi:hypothetical protein
MLSQLSIRPFAPPSSWTKLIVLPSKKRSEMRKSIALVMNRLPPHPRHLLPLSPPLLLALSANFANGMAIPSPSASSTEMRSRTLENLALSARLVLNRLRRTLTSLLSQQEMQVFALFTPLTPLRLYNSTLTPIGMQTQVLQLT